MAQQGTVQLNNLEHNQQNDVSLRYIIELLIFHTNTPTPHLHPRKFALILVVGCLHQHQHLGKEGIISNSAQAKYEVLLAALNQVPQPVTNDSGAELTCRLVMHEGCSLVVCLAVLNFRDLLWTSFQCTWLPVSNPCAVIALHIVEKVFPRALHGRCNKIGGRLFDTNK